MFVDGLWASGMTLHIHRNGAPIPKGMQSEYIKLELSPVQMNAIAAVLGLGYRDGELLYYKDDDVDNNIMRDDGFGLKSEYYSLNSESRRARRSVRISNSFASSNVGRNTTVVKDNNGVFDFVMPNTPQAVPFADNDDSEDEDTSEFLSNVDTSDFLDMLVAEDEDPIDEYSKRILEMQNDHEGNGSDK